MESVKIILSQRSEHTLKKMIRDYRKTYLIGIAEYTDESTKEELINTIISLFKSNGVVYSDEWKAVRDMIEEELRMFDANGTNIKKRIDNVTGRVTVFDTMITRERGFRFNPGKWEIL